MGAYPGMVFYEQDEETYPLNDFLKSSIVVIIPSYNEERFIGSVVLRIMRYPVRVIVVDDGSKDNTAQIASSAGATVVRLDKNQGKAGALNAGFQEARVYNPDAVVVIDADGQHNVEDLPHVVRPILRGEADIVIGSRYIRKTSKVPAHRILGHVVFNILTRLTSGVEVTDSQSGYRAFSSKALEVSSFHSTGFAVESEMQFIAGQHGLRVVEVPITICYLDKPKRSVIDQGLHVFNGVVRLTSQYHPLICFGGPGAILCLIGLITGIIVIVRFNIFHELAVGHTLFAILAAVFGIVLVTCGVILNTVQSLLRKFFDDIINRGLLGENRWAGGKNK